MLNHFLLRDNLFAPCTKTKNGKKVNSEYNPSHLLKRLVEISFLPLSLVGLAAFMILSAVGFVFCVLLHQAQLLHVSFSIISPPKLLSSPCSTGLFQRISLLHPGHMPPVSHRSLLIFVLPGSFSSLLLTAQASGPYSNAGLTTLCRFLVGDIFFLQFLRVSKSKQILV